MLNKRKLNKQHKRINLNKSKKNRLLNNLSKFDIIKHTSKTFKTKKHFCKISLK
jgi:hypothetical protein